MIAFLVLFLLCLSLSAFFSGFEMAFVSTSRSKIRELADAGSPVAQRILQLYERPQDFLSTVLIGNNIVNVLTTVLIAYEFKERFGIDNEWLVTATVVPVLIIFGEMVPKDYGRVLGQSVLLKFTGIYDIFAVLFKIPTNIIMRTVNFFLKALGATKKRSIFVSEKEFRLMIEESTQSGVLDHHEKQIIERILDFERVQVHSLMVPLEQVPAIAITGTIAEVKRMAQRTQTKLVLVYEEIPAIVVGIVYVFDLLFEENENQTLKNYLRSPIFLPQDTSAEKAFLTLQQKRQSYAVVTDSKNEVAGIASIERLITV